MRLKLLPLTLSHASDKADDSSHDRPPGFLDDSIAVLDVLYRSRHSAAGSKSLSGSRTSTTSDSSFGSVPAESKHEYLRERIVLIEAKDVLATLGMLAGHDGRAVPTKRASARAVWRFTPDVRFPFTAPARRQTRKATSL